MREVFVEGRGITLAPTMVLADGGEADVYDISSIIPGTALKLWKPPNHASYKGNDSLAQRNRDGARLRLAEQQHKMKAFPRNLPPRVIVPQKLVYDKAGKLIVGYTMRLLQGAEVLRSYGQIPFRTQSGISNNEVAGIFLDLHHTVEALHLGHVVIGDFNNLNELVKGKEVFLIDSDSFQFGGFPCRSFTTRYVDPLICDAKASVLDQVAPHNEESDWYAYALMLFESLLLVHPYGGVYKAANPKQRVAQGERPLKRISVFHPQVTYPAQAVPLDYLPDEVLHFYTELLDKGVRGIFPRHLLEELRWTKCINCGTEHAKQHCPSCATKAPQAAVVEIVRRNVVVRRLFITSGVILRAAYQDGKLNYLCHENGKLMREDGRKVIDGVLMPGIHYRLSGDDTLLASQGQLVRIDAAGHVSSGQAVDHFRGLAPSFDSNSDHVYWVQNGHLLRDHLGSTRILGDVLSNQTWFRVGGRFGFGFYRAGDIQVAFVFDTEHAGIKDTVPLPLLRGQLIDATCYFTDQRCWFIGTFQDAGRTINRCFLMSSDGRVIDSLEAEEGDGSWLGSIRNKCAATLKGQQGPVHCLFSLADNGLVRLQEVQGTIEQNAEFPDTEGLITPEDTLFMGREGLYLVNRREVRLMTMTS